jgi:hypothetical protein
LELFHPNANAVGQTTFRGENDRLAFGKPFLNLDLFIVHQPDLDVLQPGDAVADDINLPGSISSAEERGTWNEERRRFFAGENASADTGVPHLIALFLKKQEFSLIGFSCVFQ